MTDKSDRGTVPVSKHSINAAGKVLLAAVIVATVSGQAVIAAGGIGPQSSEDVGLSVQDTPTVTVGDRDVEVGEEVTVPVLLSEAPAGVAGFNISVTTSNPSAVTIVDVAVADQFGFTDQSVDEEQAVLIASDSDDQVQSGATGIQLGTVTLRAEETGTTELQVSITQLDDDDGSRIVPDVEPGTVNVEPTDKATDTQTATPTATTSPTATATDSPTATATDSPTATATDSPTQTEGMTASPTAGTVTETGGPGFTVGLAVLALLGVTIAGRFLSNRRE